MIDRMGGATIRELLSYFPALVLTGARQTGKTTLLKALLPEYSYVSLDLPSVAAMAEENPEEFFSRYPKPLIVDEVQYAPRLFRHLKARIDEDRHSMGSYVLTGSQKFTLMKEVSDSLAGRAAIVELEGLCAAELRGTSAFIDAEVPERIARGGFPELWRVPDFPRDAYMSAYMSAYLERDVRQILNIGSLRDFERFVRALAARNAGELDLSALGAAVGVTGKTAAAWLSVLEASNQIAILEPWHGNVGKRIVKRPKVYFRDTGLAAWLVGIGEKSLRDSPFVGPLWETAVFAELRRIAAARGMNRQFYFYRDNGGTEVDFLVLGEGCRLIECKWNESPGQDDAAGISRLAASAAAERSPEFKGAQGFVMCRTRLPYPIPTEGIKVEALGLEDVGRLLAAE